MSRFAAVRFGHFLPSLLLLFGGLLLARLAVLSEFFTSLFNVLPTLLLLLIAGGIIYFFWNAARSAADSSTGSVSQVSCSASE